MAWLNLCCNVSISACFSSLIYWEIYWGSEDPAPDLATLAGGGQQITKLTHFPHL